MAVIFATTHDKVEALYVGYFARAADPAGLNYWVGQLDSGAVSYAQAAASFSVQAEATAAYPFLANPGGGNSGAFIDQVYMNLFNRTADAAGKAWWQGELTAANNNPAAIASFILNVISGAQGSDATAMTNKVAVAGHFTDGLAAANQPYDAAAAAESRSEIMATDSTFASVTVNQTRADTYVTAVSPPPPPPPGQTFSLAAASSSVDEGQHDLVTLTTTNVPAGTTLGYTISGIAASRVAGGLTGTVTVDSTGHAVIDLSVLANGAPDGATTAVVTLNNGLASANVAVNDTSTTGGGGGGGGGIGFTLTTANDDLAGGSGNDSFAGTHSDGGSNTFNLGDRLAGNGGTDTLTITPSILSAATSLVDGLWTNVSSIENVSVTDGPGVINMTTGAGFQGAFGAGGVNLSATTTGGAINIDMSTFTGWAALTTSSGAGAETITTGSGVGYVTASTTAGALTILGAGLSVVSATTTGAGAQTIGDLVGGGANLVNVTATGNSGVQNIHSTSTSAVTVNATSNSGPQFITTGSANDSIVIGSSGAAGSINGGGGADAITLGATHSGVDRIIVTGGQSVQTAFDTVRNFSMAVSDELQLGSTTLLNSAQMGGTWTVTSGMAEDVGATLADFLLAASTSLTAGVVGFNTGADTYVVASDGLASGALDTVVELIGITSATAIGGAAAVTMIHIV